MAFVGSITEIEGARKAAQCVFLAESLGLIVDGDLTSLTAAQDAVDAAEALQPIHQRIYAAQIKKALKAAVAYGANVTASSLATFYDGLPAHNDTKRRLFG